MMADQPWRWISQNGHRKYGGFGLELFPPLAYNYLSMKKMENAKYEKYLNLYKT